MNRRLLLGSLRFRLTAWFTGILAVVLIIGTLVTFLVVRHILLAETDGFLNSEWHRLSVIGLNGSSDSEDLIDLKEAINLPPLPPAFHPSDFLVFNLVYVRVLGPGSSVIAETSALAAHPVQQRALDYARLAYRKKLIPLEFAGSDSEDALRVLTMPTRLGNAPVTLQVAVPWDHNEDILEHLAIILSFCVVALLPIAAIGGWVLVERTLQPIRRIVAEADHLDAYDLPETLLPQAVETDSEVGQLVSTLNRMITRLRSTFESQRRFVADASHELRTPLTILRGEIELALSRPRALRTYQATLASALEEITRMSRIVETLSYLARQDAGLNQAHTHFRQVDLGALSREVAEEFRPIAQTKEVLIKPPLSERSASEEKVVVKGDLDQLRQLLRNLMDNAVKYTPEGGSISIDVNRHQHPQSATLVIDDTGIGIQEENLPFIFNRFWRADSSRSSGGTGLGLSLCQEIISSHSGTIAVSSRVGQGTRFTVTLPLDHVH